PPAGSAASVSPPPSSAASVSPPQGEGPTAVAPATTPAWGARRATASGIQTDPSRRPRPRSVLGRYTFAAVLIVVGLAALLDRFEAIDLEPRHYPALALVVIGLGLLTGALWGRARGLILLGILVTPLAFGAGMIDVPLRGGFGERFYAPLETSELRDEYRLVAGELNLDLTDLEWGAEPVEIDASVAMGELFVTVPSDITVDFRGHAAMGEVSAFGETRGGVGVNLDVVDEAAGDAPTLILDASASMGSVQVTRSPRLGREAPEGGLR
ncbi:MAG: cell wall-active antibiotics response protein, partial [Actinomycetota bacterium]|nr:cell wall-active antibiotics response protein [Actinomycetota bacterium]